MSSTLDTSTWLQELSCTEEIFSGQLETRTTKAIRLVFIVLPVFVKCWAQSDVEHQEILHR